MIPLQYLWIQCSCCLLLIYTLYRAGPHPNFLQNDQVFHNTWLAVSSSAVSMDLVYYPAGFQLSHRKPTLTLLLPFLYICRTAFTSYSSKLPTSGHLRALCQKPSPRQWKRNSGVCFLRGTFLKLMQKEYSINGTFSWHNAKMHLVDIHCISEALSYPLKHFHDLVKQLKTSAISPLQSITFTLIQVYNIASVI